MNRVRTRFAPSPTGSLHLGNARTAVLNWLIARHHGGDFVLRIEDTDADRNVEGAEAGLLEDLRWLGLDWDEGPGDAGDLGPHAPYHQSGRRSLYERQATRLLESGRAYRCFCSPEELATERDRARAEGRSPRYGGACRALSSEEGTRRSESGDPYVLRLATPERGEVVVNDHIRGRVTFDAGEIGDFVIVRSDGVPTYNFAVVVDDTEMEITHVIRGAGHLSNTPHQLLVYDALGVEPPQFAHAPTVLGPDRKKLSKRTGARSLRSLREEGLHPDAVVNYLSLLGWSSPSGEEVLERDRLVREVTLERMGAADVVFDPDKLRWMSARHIDRMSVEELAAAVRPWVDRSEARTLEGEPYERAIEAVRTHFSAFGDAPGRLVPFLGAGADAGPSGEVIVSEESRRVVAAVRDQLAAVENWTPEEIQRAVKAGGASAGAKGRDLYIPVRVAVTGEEHGPPLTALLEVQGREQVLAALDGVLDAGGGVPPVSPDAPSSDRV